MRRPDAWLHPSLRFKAMLLAVTLASVFSWNCKRESPGARRIYENGVEVVVNGLEPDRAANGGKRLRLHEDMRLDLENESFAEIGLTDVERIDVDSKGRIYLFKWRNAGGPGVFLFDGSGRFLRSFGLVGQGPGELQGPTFLGLSERDEVVVLEPRRKAIRFLDSDRDSDRSLEIGMDLRISPLQREATLANGSFLIEVLRLSPQRAIQGISAGILDPRSQEFRSLSDYGDGELDELRSIFDVVPIFGRSRTSIFLGFTRNGTDISVYDLNGRLTRIIRKEYPRVPVLPAWEDDFKALMPPGFPIAKSFRLPAVFPAFQDFFADDEGRLYVVTFDKEAATGQNVCEIFSPDGTYVERAAIGYFDYLKWIFRQQRSNVVARGGRFYCLREKDSGFKEIIVSSARWE